MFNIRLFILLIPLIHAGASLIIQLDDGAASTKIHARQSEDVPPKVNVDGKSYHIVGEYNQKADEDPSARQSSLGGVLLNGVKNFYHGIEPLPVKTIHKGRQGFVITDESVEDASDRIDNVETKVEGLSNELHNFETIASIYFLARLFSGLFCSIL